MHAKATLLAAVMLVAAPAAPARADLVLPPPGSFTIAVLPDTQVYAQSYPHIFTAQTQWIKDHRTSHDIEYVLHLGDVTNNNTPVQWNNAKASMSVLDGYVPYAIATGNHDYGPGGSTSSRATLFNSDAYFGPNSAYAAQPTVGGFYESGKTDNSYHTFNAGGRDWLVMALEWGPRDGAVDWANRVLDDHPDHTTILITHAFTYSDDTRYDWDVWGSRQTWNPHAYASASDPDGTNDGQDLWEKLVSKHNVAMVLSGHVLYDGTGRMISVGDNGQVIHEMLSNYQMITNGGNGFMRLLEIQPDGQTVKVRTYSPYLDACNTAPDQQFTIGLVDGPIERHHSRAVLKDDPILYYRLDTTDADGPVANLGTAGSLLDGVYRGSGPMASDFNGDSHVQITGSVPEMSQWSIAAWAQTDTPENGQTILSSRGGGSDEVLFGLGTDAGGAAGLSRWGLSHLDNGSLPTVVGADEAAVAGQWYHLVATSDGDTLRLYVDGELVDEAAAGGGDLGFGGTLTRIGSGFGGSDGGAPFDGTIGELALFDKVLTISDVTEHRLAALNRVTAANVLIGGPANGTGTASVGQQAVPGVGVLQTGQGRVQITVAGSGLDPRRGLLLATVAEDQRDALRGTVEVQRSASGGMSVSLAEAGFTGGFMNNINVNAALAWFPFSGGWTAAHVNGSGTIAAAAGVDSSMITPDPTQSGRYTVDLGVDSQDDGMLFTIGGQGGDNIVPTAVLADGSGWDVRVQDNAANLTDDAETGAFSFLYLPYDTSNLIGGRYDGRSEENLRSVGDFAMTAAGRGEYRLSIEGQSPESGMLLLTISGFDTSGGFTAPDDNILTYEPDGQDFIIRSYDLPYVRPRDTEFVWAFVSFSDPVVLPEPTTLAMLASFGGFGLLGYVRRRRARRADQRCSGAP